MTPPMCQGRGPGGLRLLRCPAHLASLPTEARGVAGPKGGRSRNATRPPSKELKQALAA
jgi:hypothetical protein